MSLRRHELEGENLAFAEDLKNLIQTKYGNMQAYSMLALLSMITGALGASLIKRGEDTVTIKEIISMNVLNGLETEQQGSLQ